MARRPGTGGQRVGRAAVLGVASPRPRRQGEVADGDGDSGRHGRIYHGAASGVRCGIGVVQPQPVPRRHARQPQLRRSPGGDRYSHADRRRTARPPHRIGGPGRALRDRSVSSAGTLALTRRVGGDCARHRVRPAGRVAGVAGDACSVDPARRPPRGHIARQSWSHHSWRHIPTGHRAARQWPAGRCWS